MEATQTANPNSFEEVWAILREVSESQKESDRAMKESKEDFNRRLGALTNLFGDFTEAMMAPKLCEKFREFGLDFHKASRDIKIKDKVKNFSLEVDFLLENGDKAVLVEVKTKLTVERVNKHIERLEKMRAYANLRGDKRAFLGAVAGVVVTDEAKNYALDHGFYLIEPSGEDLTITPPNGKPKEW
jgi:predicted nuclease of restriction endonuclease-like RecB superfamily